MAGPNWNYIDGDTRNLSIIIADMSRIIDEDTSFSDYILKDGSRAYTGTGAGFKDEDNMASDSAVATASQQSIKKYVDDTAAGQFYFKTITGITNNVVADVADDTLTLASGNNILGIVGTTATDTITFTIDQSNITGTGALDSGSITSGFGTIDNGSSNITTLGTISGGTLTDGTASITGGIGTFERVNVYSPADDGAASLFIANAGDTDNYFRFQDQSDAIGNIIKTSPTGSIIRIDPLPADNTSAATIGMFRTTNTTDGVTLKLYTGDGTDTVSILLEANNGNITTAGEITGGLGVFTEVNIYSAAGSADLILATGGDLTSFGRVYDNGDTQFKIEKTTASDAGSSTIFLNPMPQDGTSSAKIEAFRSTNTVGLRQLTLYKGDGGATKTIILDAGTGDATFAGNLIVEGGNIGTAAGPGTIQFTNGTVSIDNSLEVDSIGPYSAFDSDLIELAVDSVTINGALSVTGISRLDGWLGIGTDPTASNPINVLATRNGQSGIAISNQGADTGSYAALIASSDSGTLNVLTHGSNRVVVRQGQTIGGTGELLFNGIPAIIGTLGTNSIFLGTNNTLAMTIDGTTQRISMTSGLDVTGEATVNDKIKLTAIGGYAIKITNTTGAVTVAGQVVKADPATNDAVILSAADDLETFGVFLDSGVADDAEAWVVTSGIADVAMEDNTAATRGNWVRTSITEAGYADATNAAAPQPISQTHFAEIGHCIESVAAGGGGTHILARCKLHFN